MRIRTRLSGYCLVIGLAPLAVAGAVAWWSAGQSLDQAVGVARESTTSQAGRQLVSLRDSRKAAIEAYFAGARDDLQGLADTVGTLRDEAFRRLEGQRQVKAAAVERYFATILGQIANFAQDSSVVTATARLRLATDLVLDEARPSDGDRARMRDEVRGFYDKEFAAKFRTATGGALDVDTCFEPLDDTSILLQDAYIAGNPNPTGEKQKLDAAPAGLEYDRAHAEVHAWLRRFLEDFGYRDIQLCDPHSGRIVYSVLKQVDFGTSLIDGPYAKSSAGEAFRQVVAAGKTDHVVLVDYQPYTPSYGAPASFAGAPLYDGDDLVGVALFELPIDHLDEVMTDRTGLGRTGQTYLVGPDHLMRSDAPFDTEHRSVAASFADPEHGKVDTRAVTEALAGTSGTDVIRNYAGSPVLSSWTPVAIGGTSWALVAEVDVAEAYCPQDAAGTEFLAKLQQRLGYHDVFLVGADGYCFYTAGRKADYHANLLEGPLKDSGLGRVTRTAIDSKELGFADFAPYAPNDGKPVAFVGLPIARGDKVDLVVALQLPLDKIDAVMGSRAGLGATAETLLVGPDHLMRCDSFLDREHHSVAASFADPEHGKIADSMTSKALTAGGVGLESGVVDYRGRDTLVAYAPVDVFGRTWALIAKIDSSEALADVGRIDAVSAQAKHGLLVSNLMVGSITVLVVLALGLWIARGIARPIQTAAGTMARISEGDLTLRLSSDRRDELGDLTRGLNEFVTWIHRTVRTFGENAATVASAATELLASAQGIARDARGSSEQVESASAAAEELSTNMVSMSASIEETTNNVGMMADAAQKMSAAIAEVARNAENGAGVAQRASELTEATNARVGELNEAAQAIGRVIETIQEIAAQTNLLALNATIEAARAGEAGKGFTVVAHEVKELADQTSSATGDIRRMIENIQATTANAIRSIREINEVISEVNVSSRAIATAMDEQDSATAEISGHAATAARVVEIVSTSIAESTTATRDITASMTAVNDAIRVTSDNAGQTETAGEELSRLSESLTSAIKQFKV